MWWQRFQRFSSAMFSLFQVHGTMSLTKTRKYAYSGCIHMSTPQTCYIHVFICRSSQAIRGIPLSWQSAVSWGWCCERAQPRVVFYRDLNTFLLAVVTHSFQTLKMINTSLIHCTHATQMSISMLKEIGWRTEADRRILFNSEDNRWLSCA